MRLLIFKDKFSKKKIGIKRGLEMIYNLEFTGFVQIERMWWWRNYIEYTTYVEIEWPQKGYLSLVRLNDTHKHPNTIRVLTRQQANSDKRELLVLNKLYGKEEEIYERKRLLKQNWVDVKEQKKTFRV